MPFSFGTGAPLILDGATGSYLATFGLNESDYAGTLGLAKPQYGNNELLTITNPAAVTRLHEDYLRAGADIVTACTFCAVRPIQEQRGASEYTHEMALRGARLAKEAAERFSTADRPRYAAGSVGPTDRPLSLVLAQDENEDVEPDELIDALKRDYFEQISGIVEGGVDLLLIETCFDPLNASAALDAAHEVFSKLGVRIPVIVSASVSSSGRLFTGETPAQFFAKLPSVDGCALNCGSPEDLLPAVREFAPEARAPLGFYPNAGLPDADGHYSLEPEVFAEEMAAVASELSPAFVGGCCGTTPAHIAALANRLAAH